MKIGELAQASGVSVDTLRFWEKQGLLKANRGGNGYRYYDQGSIHTLNFVLAMKSLGFALEDIRELLEIRVDKDSHTCAEVKSVAQGQLQQVEKRLAQLQKIRGALSAMIEACQGGQAQAQHCSILETLEAQNQLL
ncbi:Zn(2+)-responsive transcriptional regulator [Gallaecimonas xiamenensis]|uniref:Zinc-responsive transcriptional regulator n=1 Tax=Gallaecimonas xiamenensis 3-C-1 TaxID=745411 RepID=K2J4Q7_9GAMM|nr:Zn(2+)-responsive transcriptional regulator [Gallaecimonas xiamenensis]EKE69892.1 zinc-responsive transcriptional regulator [Gallaecimonas xiamenensis 3-C-1]